jgi:two-component system OmpR family sensor kinase
MKRWLPILAPAILGLGVGIWVNASPLPNPVLAIRVQISVLIVLMGFLLSLVAAVSMLLWDWADRLRVHTTLNAAEDRRSFLRRLDHELKNPLTAILAGLANLSTSSENAVEQAALGSVEAQVQRLRRLVADLRKLSDLETRPLERTSVDMNELLAEVFSFAESSPYASDRGLNLAVPHAPWPLPVVQGDRDLLFLALHNLLDNALKFSKAGDTIEMRASEDGANVVVEVADTGPGIAEEDMPHIWDELYRGAGARGIPGSGLGLALTQAIVTRHSGQVSIRSRMGQGTVVTIRLPTEEHLKR